MTNKATNVYVLTSEYNDYDQHGDYFVACFKEKPSIQKLAEYFKENRLAHNSNDLMDTLAFLEHLREGGGRRNSEDFWYNLEKVEVIS